MVCGLITHKLFLLDGGVYKDIIYYFTLNLMLILDKFKN